MQSESEIKKIFEGFNNLKVLIIGDVMIDSYLWGKVERISPEAPVPIVSVKKRENRLGGAANVALNISALGAKPYLCSVIGNDLRGKQFIEIMTESGLHADGIVVSDNRITTTKFRIIGNNIQMLRVDEEMDNILNDNECKVLEDKIKSLFITVKPDVIIFQDYNKGTLNNKLITNIIKQASNSDIAVVVDPKLKNFNSFENVTLFKPNLKELKEGLKNNDENFSIETHSDIILDFQKKQNINIILLTLSEKGVYVSYKDCEKGDYFNKNIPAHIRAIADVSGAGDTVISVAALCIAMKANPILTAAISNLAGGLVCEKVGVVPVEKDILEKEAIKLCSYYTT